MDDVRCTDEGNPKETLLSINQGTVLAIQPYCFQNLEAYWFTSLLVGGKHLYTEGSEM